MNAFSFLDLIREIFFTKKPDIEKIQKKGLLAVKIAQTFALRVDFLDEARCFELAKLYNHVTKIPLENIDALIEKYVGPEWLNNFTSFEKESFASASIGQVHRAVLPSGELAAVKIIKGDFKAQFQKDVASALRLFKWLIRFYPKLAKVADPIGILNSIRKFTLDELDLRNELANRNLLYDIYEVNKERADLSRLEFIKIIPELSSENVMVSEYIMGDTDFENSTVSQVSLTKRMMETIKLGVHAGMSFEQGMFPIIKSLMYLDGMVLRCNPQAVLMQDMRRYIDEFNDFM